MRLRIPEQSHVQLPFFLQKSPAENLKMSKPYHQQMVGKLNGREMLT